MSLVPSTFLLTPGSQAPDFSLPDPRTGENVSLAEVSGSAGTLVVFACNHCPYVVHLARELGQLAEKIKVEGVSTVAISSNDVENYPQDSPDKMVQFADQSGWVFPYLYDQSQEVAHAYSAACTPDFFLFDANGKLFYAGQFDDSRPGSGVATGEDLRRAVGQMVGGFTPLEGGKPATGCNIKWKPSNEPKYFG